MNRHGNANSGAGECTDHLDNDRILAPTGDLH